ncbi:MAG: HEAT repeat domain-containing protein [Gammaproteobacteria bacterium]|nr:HEAT repeat domain-containing protein [Gammaproteobacteria bacterium]
MRSTNICRFCRYCALGLGLNLLIVESIADASGVSTSAALRPSPGARSSGVQFGDGVLSVNAKDVALIELLDEIGRRSGLTVVPLVTLAQRVDVTFDRLPLEQGLRQILRHRSFALKYTPTTRGQARAETLWILPQGDEKYEAQGPRLANASSNKVGQRNIDDEISQLRSTLSNSDSEYRQQAAVELGAQANVNAVSPLRQALTDSDADVQQAAIFSLAQIGGTESALALATALHDSNPRIREQAIEALGDVGGAVAMGLIEKALTDDVAVVRLAASETLEQLRGTGR